MILIQLLFEIFILLLKLIRIILETFLINLIKFQDNSKLVVNCFGGISRSASSVATYLILKKGMTAQEALTTLKKGRDVWPSNPNLGFLAKLSNKTHGFESVEEGNTFGDTALRDICKNYKE